MDTEVKAANAKEIKEVKDTEMTAEESKPTDSPPIDEKLIEGHEGLQIIEDVFTKKLPTPTDATGSEGATQATNASTEGSEEGASGEEDGESGKGATGKEEKAKPEGEAEVAASIGPAVPTEKDFDPEEIKKAEEFKAKGNEYFKGKERI